MGGVIGSLPLAEDSSWAVVPLLLFGGSPPSNSPRNHRVTSVLTAASAPLLPNGYRGMLPLGPPGTTA